MLRTPRLRTVFVLVNVVILLVPLGGIVLLRLYESALIRRAESELFAQGAFIVAAVRLELRAALEADGATAASAYGLPVNPAPTTDPPRTRISPNEEGRDPDFQPMLARLNLATDSVLPPSAPARPAAEPPDPVALAVGDRLTPFLREGQLTTLAGIRVVDYRGTVIATTRSERGQSLAHREEVQGVLAGADVRLLRRRQSDEAPPALDSLSRTTKVRVVVALPIIEADRLWGAVILARTPMSVQQSLYGIRWHILAGAGGLFASVVLISAFTSFTVTRPVDELIRQTERVAAGDRAAAEPLAKPGTHEVAQLSAAVAHMARSLEQRADYIRSFASSVSHEFKTPLTSIRGAIELLRDHGDEMTAAERERFLSNLDQDAERLGRLTSRLLELARADVVTAGSARTAVTPVLERLVTRYRADGLAIELRPAADLGDARVTAETLESIVTNLIDNARRHGGDGVHVVLAGRSTGLPQARRTEIDISDDGPGISEANRSRVFDPFFTTARATGGTGLGLAIVRALVDAHGGAIELSSEPGNTRFRISLPG